MPLTNAQKQARFAARRKAKLERLAVLEGALRGLYEAVVSERGDEDFPDDSPLGEARKALEDVG